MCGPPRKQKRPQSKPNGKHVREESPAVKEELNDSSEELMQGPSRKKSKSTKEGGRGTSSDKTSSAAKKRKHPTPFSVEEDQLLLDWMKELIHTNSSEAYKLMEEHDRGRTAIKARILVLLRRLDKS